MQRAHRPSVLGAEEASILLNADAQCPAMSILVRDQIRYAALPCHDASENSKARAVCGATAVAQLHHAQQGDLWTDWACEECMLCADGQEAAGCDASASCDRARPSIPGAVPTFDPNHADCQETPPRVGHVVSRGVTLTLNSCNTFRQTISLVVGGGGLTLLAMHRSPRRGIACLQADFHA